MMDLRKFLTAAVLAMACTAQAAMVSLVPSHTALTVGQALSVDVVFDDLSAGQAVGAFDLDLTYDAALLSVTAISFGAALGIDGVDQFTIAVLGVGHVDFAAVSLLSETDLLAAQNGPFVLATLTFNALQAGLAEIRFDTLTPPGLLFSDAFGNALPATVGREADVRIGADGNTVPEPASLALTVLALGLAIAPRRAARR